MSRLLKSLLDEINMKVLVLHLLIYCGVLAKDLPYAVRNLISNVRDFNAFVETFSLEQDLERLKNALGSVARGGDAGNIFTLENEECKPRPVIVEVPQPSDPNSFHFPYYVTLHRCGGSCNANPFSSTCQPSAVQALDVGVVHVNWGGSSLSQNSVSLEPKIARASFVNHTACSCKCDADERSCNRFQIWEPSLCKCSCNNYCPMNYVRDAEVCCKCSEELSCSKRHQWSWETCACECRRGWTCGRSFKVRDPESCKCICPEIQCRDGFELNQRSCDCESKSIET